jgi:predicted DsbA family dithiol-disulfide isomerase
MTSKRAPSGVEPASYHRARHVTALFGLLAFGGAGLLAGMALSSARPTREIPIVAPADPAWESGGIAFDARVPHAGDDIGHPTMRVFVDYQCPACRELEHTLGDTLRRLATSGRLRVVYHQAPLAAHRRSRMAAALAYCAERGPAAAVIHRSLYDAAVDWSRSASPLERLLAVVASAGGDPGAALACVVSGEGSRRVERDLTLARTLGLSVVPAVFLDDTRLEFPSWRSLLRHVVRRTAS